MIKKALMVGLSVIAISQSAQANLPDVIGDTCPAGSELVNFKADVTDFIPVAFDASTKTFTVTMMRSKFSRISPDMFLSLSPMTLHEGEDEDNIHSPLESSLVANSSTPVEFQVDADFKVKVCSYTSSVDPHFTATLTQEVG